MIGVFVPSEVNEMEISLVEERAQILHEQLSMDQAEGRAWSQRMSAFGRLERVTSLFARPKDDDFELLYKEKRYQPFWHIICTARYVYERRRAYTLKVSSPEVKAVTIEGMQYDATSGAVNLSGLEHCREELRKELYIDGLANAPDPALADYLQYPTTVIAEDDLDDFQPEDAIVVPPQARATAVVRDILIGMIKSVEADRIIEDSIGVERVDLYYRPVYAFQYRWISKDKETVIEYDAMTGKMQPGGKIFQQYLGKFLDPEFLFDIGVETVDLLVPGGGLAIKLAKRGIEAAQSRKREQGE
jgi:hypothetical protein